MTRLTRLPLTRRRSVAALLAAAVTAVLLPFVATISPAQATPANNDELYLFCKINELRVLEGRAPLAWNASTAAGARAWSQALVNGAIGHDPDFVDGAEIIGAAPTVNVVLQGFWDSTPHRTLMLIPSMTRMGVGVAYHPNGNRFVTVRFEEGSGSSPQPTCEDGGGPTSSTTTSTTSTSTTSSTSTSVPSTTTTTKPKPPSPPAPKRPFVDVPKGSYFYNPVYWLYDRGVTTGCGTPIRYCPYDSVTRAQSITFLHRLAGTPAQYGTTFWDVPGNSWFAASTRWGRRVGLTTGVGGSNYFEPHRPITRAEFITMLHRFAGQPNKGTWHGFIDGVPGYATRAVAWAKAHGITTGIGGDHRFFGPNQPITRAEIAAFLVRYAGKTAAHGPKAIKIRV